MGYAMQDERGPGQFAGGAETERVGDGEWLYCRVLPAWNPPHYRLDGSRLEVLAQAFSQRAMPDGPYSGQYRLSMDRAMLCGADPSVTQRGGPNVAPSVIGVVRFQAGELRALPDVADVEPEPVVGDPDLPDNPAHAAVCVRHTPGASKSANKTPYENVRRELAAIVNRDPSRWEIKPSAPLPS
jgi:hypothetical protein